MARTEIFPADGVPALWAHERIIRRTALASPDLTAVTETDGSHLSYAELAERVRSLALALAAAGVGPDVAVPVRVRRSSDAIIALLAALEAGGVYAPLDPAWPDARTALVLERLGATLCVTDQELPAGLVASGIRVLSPRPEPDPTTAAKPTSQLRPDHLAYVLHTSGSTGTPKSVGMTHRGLTRLIDWQIASGPTGLTTLNLTATGFDVTFQEVLSTLATGGRLCLVPEDVCRDPERLLALIDAQSVERIFLPYVALRQLAWASRRTGIAPKSLCHVVTAGERLVLTEEIAGFFGRLPGCRLDNHYGPTEAHLVTSHTLTGDAAGWPALPPIGTAVTGAEVRILDQDLAPVAAGQEGELFVAGPGLARGYVGEPGLTGERFLADPYAARPGERMYRTGDIVRQDADGTVHYVGRTDGQIKVRGYRVEPAEVEIVLAKHPGVREAVVGQRTLVGDVSGLVAYVVPERPEDGDALTTAALLNHARGALPDYMVPSRFVLLPELPRTETGKVDLHVLHHTELPAEPGAADAGGADGETLTATVTRLWRRVLGHDEFDEDDDFFDVGGDSLLATWVVAELSHALGQEIELALLLAESTVADLVRALTDTGHGTAARAAGSEVRTLSPGPSGRALFLFHALGGELLPYRELARALTAPVRVLGVRLTGGEGDRARSVPELVRMHLEQIRLVQPEGPYLLAGWSYGGVLAFEAARQLVEAGEAVEFLGLIDANPAYDPITGLAPADTPYLALLARALTAIEAQGPDDAADLAAIADDDAWAALMGASAAAITGQSARHFTRQLRAAHDGMRAAIEYVPRPYPGDAVLFQAEATAPDTRGRLARDLAALVGGRLEVHAVPGGHADLVAAPHVVRLASLMDEAIEHSKETATHGS